MKTVRCLHCDVLITVAGWFEPGKLHGPTPRTIRCWSCQCEVEIPEPEHRPEPEQSEGRGD